MARAPRGFLGPPGIITGKPGWRWRIFDRRMPRGPFSLARDTVLACPSESGPPNTDAITARRAALFDKIKEAVDGIDNNGAGRGGAIIGNFLWQELRRKRQRAWVNLARHFCPGIRRRRPGARAACLRRRVNRDIARLKLHDPGIGEIGRQHDWRWREITARLGDGRTRS